MVISHLGGLEPRGPDWKSGPRMKNTGIGIPRWVDHKRCAVLDFFGRSFLA